MTLQRKIIHIDMDAFFASVEQRDHPDYQGKPVIVGGQPNSRGVVAACSYEARKFGIHSAMPSSRAYRLCPEAIFIPPRFEAYRHVSNQIREIFWRYAAEVEPLSLDEAYLDVTDTTDFHGSATLIAKAIKKDILNTTQLNASAGVSFNKFLAKIASDIDKPNGLYVIRPEQGADFVAQLKVGQFHGIGPATEKKMHALGIETGEDLRQQSLEELVDHFGKTGHYYYHIARATDNRPVRSERQRKSLGKETTFQEDMVSTVDITVVLYQLAEQVLSNLEKQHLKAKTITIKVKYANFHQVTRAYTADESLVFRSLKKLIPQLLSKTKVGIEPVRLVGLSLSNFHESSALKVSQLDLDLNEHF